MQLFVAQERIDRFENRFVVNTSHPDYPNWIDYWNRVVGKRALTQQEERLNREQTTLNDMFRRLAQIESGIPDQVMKVHALQQYVDEKTKKKKDDADKDRVLNQIALQKAQLDDYARGLRNGAIQPGGHPSITRQRGPIPQEAKALPLVSMITPPVPPAISHVDLTNDDDEEEDYYDDDDVWMTSDEKKEEKEEIDDQFSQLLLKK